MVFRNYNKVFPVRKSMHHLQQYIDEKRKQGWEVVGKIRQNYNGDYCCMMEKLDSKEDSDNA